MDRIKVEFQREAANSEYGYYEKGDTGVIVGYTQGCAVVLKDDGSFVKAELSWIKEVKNIIPEQRIRKSLSAYFAKFKPDDMWDADFSFGDIVAWLESQGETSPVLSNSSNIGKVEQKPSWSEEDKVMLESIIADFCGRRLPTESQESWLKSLKDRILPQPKQEWSEEDKQFLLVCKNALAKYQVSDKWDANIISRWLENRLKSLRPQNNVTDKELAQAKKDAYNNALDKIEYHSGEPTFDDGWSAAIWYLKKRNAQPQKQWKPSDEQMNALNDVISSRDIKYDVLSELWKDLKVL